jgi:hypothetical protein
VGASFDDNWRGGFEEVFPNDAAGLFQDYSLVDHGELWSQPWKIIESAINGIKMSYRCERVPVEVEKTIVFSDGGPSVRLHYRFRHLGTRPLPYLFKLHPAIAIEAGDEILLPSCQIEPVALGFSSIIGQEGKTPFPTAHSKDGKTILINHIPPRESQTQEFFYATELSEGWAGVRSHSSKTDLKIRFDRKDIPSVWAFQSYGKWRNHYTLVLEPSTTVPRDLTEALKRKTCAVLQPGARQEYHFELRIDSF